ncbi:MAG TPA: glycosyltransferase family 39 protein, partial [Vicinamibacteria bacterium]
EPDSYINPSLSLYLPWPFVWAQDGLAAAGVLRGRATDPLLLGRALSALAAAAAVLVIGLAARRTHPGLGLMPPLLLALAPGFVNLAHFATPEAWLMLGTAATVALALGHLEGHVPAAALGLALGLTASTKYTAAALLAPALLAVLLRPRPATRPREWAALAAAGAALLAAGAPLLLGPGAALAARLHLPDARLLPPAEALAFVRGLGRALLLGGGGLLAVGAGAWAWPRLRPLARHEVVVLGAAAAGGFVAGTPYAVLDPVDFLGGLAFNALTRHEYKGLVDTGTSFGPYLGLLAAAFTGPLLAAAVLGALAAVGRAFRAERAPLVLLAAALAPYLLVASSGHRALRFLAPALPAAAWLAGLGLAALPRARGAALALVAGRAALGSLLVIRLFFVDARILAARWIEAQVPPGAVVDLIANVPNYAPTLPPGRTLRQVPVLSREMAPAPRFVEAADAYPASGAEWLVLTAAYYQRFLDHPDQQPERAAFFHDLIEGRRAYTLQARFRQQGWLRPEAEFLDPEILVLRKRPPS